ncbi:MAG: flagellin, partial [Campylobacterota bacterium]|nr:flagellin [Campylobacterota bacterium]
TKASNTEGLGGGSNTIQGVAINAAATDPITGVTSVAGNNIAVGGSQQLNSSGTIVLQDVDITATGAESAGSTVIMDIDVSGKIGSIVSANNLAIDASSQTQAIQDALSAIAISNGDFTNLGDGKFSLKGTGSVSFGDLDFSAMQITSAAVAETLKLNTGGADTTFTVSDNNTGTSNPLLGQLNISAGTAGTAIKGGNLLSDLKDVAANELTAAKANNFMATIDEALTQMNANRSDFGSTQNQLESSIRNMQTTQTNLKAAESVIRDVDYAAESANFNKQNIIAQAGTYAMSQANSMAQNVQRLLQ